jgi:cytochrome c peroxidase
LNYFKPATYEQTDQTEQGRAIFRQIGCASCHIPDLQLKRDRRVADVETAFDPEHGAFNGLFATAKVLCLSTNDQQGLPPLRPPQYGPFLVKNMYTDLRRHDVGPHFYERNYDGSEQREFMTAPLWGVGSTSPYGHDGRSINLTEVILRHGGEATEAAVHFEQLSETDRRAMLDFLNSLVLFPPDDTASNLNPANPKDPNYPQSGHGSIKLGALFNDPSDPE